MSNPIKTAGVVGLGVMGFDIAFLYAMRGYQTIVYDASGTVMEGVANRKEQTVERLRNRDRLSKSEIENLSKLLVPSGNLAGLARADLITEAVSENAEVKLALYQALREAGFNGLLATNTSSVTRATLLKDGTVDSRKFALTHFFNPVLYTKMVEVVTGDMETSHSETLLAFLKNLGRDPVATQDISGFVSNGILMVYAVMAVRLLECGARIEQVDQAATELKLLPPFISFDSWKPAIVEDVTRIMFDLRGDEFLRSSRLLSRLANENPRFYIDRKPNPRIYELADANGKSLDNASVKRALRTSMLVAAARVAELGETPAIIDFVATEGIKTPEPPLKEIDFEGAATLLQDITDVNRLLGNQSLPAPELITAMTSEKETFYKNDQANPWLHLQVRQQAHDASH